MTTFAAIAGLFGITAILSFLNDRYLRMQSDIGLLLLALISTILVRLFEMFVPAGLSEALREVTQDFNLNETLLKGVLCFMLFRGSLNVRWASLHEQRWLVLSLPLAVSLPESEWKPLILNMTFAVVVFSIIVQGLTIGRLFTKRQLDDLLRS